MNNLRMNLSRVRATRLVGCEGNTPIRLPQDQLHVVISCCGACRTVVCTCCHVRTPFVSRSFFHVPSGGLGANGESHRVRRGESRLPCDGGKGKDMVHRTAFFLNKASLLWNWTRSDRKVHRIAKCQLRAARVGVRVLKCSLAGGHRVGVLVGSNHAVGVGNPTSIWLMVHVIYSRRHPAVFTASCFSPIAAIVIGAFATTLDSSAHRNAACNTAPVLPWKKIGAMEKSERILAKLTEQVHGTKFPGARLTNAHRIWQKSIAWGHSDA